MGNIEYLKINLPEDVLKLKYYGDFNEELKHIDRLLKKGIPTALRKRLEIEKDIITVIQRQYPFSFKEALGVMQKNVKNFKEEELVALKEESAADWIFINGEVHFQNRFFLNLVKTRPDIAERLIDNGTDDDTAKKTNLLNNTIKEMKKNGGKAYYIRIKSSIKIKEEAAEPGKNINVYIPIPVKCQQVKNIHILSTSPKAKLICDENYPQRTAFFSEMLGDNREFTVEYSYENHVKYVNPDPKEVRSVQPDFDIEELAPHIMFTPYIRELLREIIGDETNPLIKARKIYDFVTTKIMYSFMREYLTIDNIPEYAAANLKGDCGVQALLFITLCRCAKIPARWQSGLYVTPYFVGNHDWAQFYIEPYGWLFADCSFGGSAYRSGEEERWNFYFGNLDPFRMPANSEFQYDFNPNKKFLRGDPYDNQRGECEYKHRGLLFYEFDSNPELIEIREL
ncbi:MAG: transglutaminase [Clostridiaceae bacterium]|nr:transglutaminase [Clostridiaceae bacterium]